MRFTFLAFCGGLILGLISVSIYGYIALGSDSSKESEQSISALPDRAKTKFAVQIDPSKKLPLSRKPESAQTASTQEQPSRSISQNEALADNLKVRYLRAFRSIFSDGPIDRDLESKTIAVLAAEASSLNEIKFDVSPANIAIESAKITSNTERQLKSLLGASRYLDVVVAMREMPVREQYSALSTMLFEGGGLSPNAQDKLVSSRTRLLAKAGIDFNVAVPSTDYGHFMDQVTAVDEGVEAQLKDFLTPRQQTALRELHAAQRIQVEAQFGAKAN